NVSLLHWWHWVPDALRLARTIKTSSVWIVISVLIFLTMPSLYPERSSLRRQAVRASRRAECCVEVEIEARVQHQIASSHVRNMDLVIAFGVHLAEVILVQEVVAYHQPFLILRQSYVWGPEPAP